jgi:MotA/TolQ/ExbB proton channel family
MFYEQFHDGGPVMYAVFGAWIIVLAGVLDRILYLSGRLWRRPMQQIYKRMSGGQRSEAALDFAHEHQRARHGLRRIDAISQLATSIGLFGTVLGISQAFFARSATNVLGPETLGAGLATALFTTVGGLIVYLFGQGFLILFVEWLSFSERRLQPALATNPIDQR